MPFAQARSCRGHRNHQPTNERPGMLLSPTYSCKPLANIVLAQAGFCPSRAIFPAPFAMENPFHGQPPGLEDRGLKSTLALRA